MSTPVFPSRLPEVGTTIFSVMSALAQQHGAVNLGQGFPDFDCDPRLLAAMNAALQAGHNQYPPMAGVPQLRERVADKIEALHGVRYDPGAELTITAGATQAILTAVLCAVHPGDEVIVLEPCYDSYAPAIQLAGGRVVRVALHEQTFRPNLAAIAAALSPRTRALIVNTPHNPTATVWTDSEWRALERLLAPTNVLLISDEVYEHMVFDGRSHLSAARYPGLRERAFVISSFGKTFHVTGWKVGYVAAPAALSAELRKVHQFNVFTVHTPTQFALADYLADPAPYLGLSEFYQARRDLFRAGLAATRLRLLPCEGTYFQCVDTRAVSDLDDAAFCHWLTTEVGVAAIPLSAFSAHTQRSHTVRFCFAKKPETLARALGLLAQL